MPRFIDIKNKRFGSLKVIEYVEKNKNNQSMWKCKCDCGEYTIVMIGNLRGGATRSCGCLKNELTSMRSKTHGLRKHPLYSVWYNIKHRCNNKNNKSYKRYGKRKIKMCSEWQTNLPKFIEYCIKHGWHKGLQIDRINNNGNYEPNNIRFVNPKTNSRNTSMSMRWIVNGVKYDSLNDASKDNGVCQKTIRIWCGIIGDHGKPPKKKKNCYAYKFYNNVI